MTDYSSALQRASSQLPWRRDQIASGLGWFSIGLGLVELLAPKQLCRTLGIEGRETLIQAYGVREIATGVGILTAADPTPWLWGRVAGDAVDLATLVIEARQPEGERRSNLSPALAAVIGVTALDVICASGLPGESSVELQSGSDASTRQKPVLRIKESGTGQIVVRDENAGHEFAFRVDFRGDVRVLGAFAPRWAGGLEPSSSARYLHDARRCAEEEARDQGWIDA